MSDWSTKLSTFLHDPVDKVLGIQGHEARAAGYAEALSQTFPSKDFYSAPDRIASSLARSALPGYSSDPNADGSVDFAATPVLTHPLAKESPEARFIIPGMDIAMLQKEIRSILERDLGLAGRYEELVAIPESERPLSGFFSPGASPEEWNKALYFYLFFALRKRLQEKNIGGLGGLWAMLPADSRMPDHSIWQHCSLVSALASCIDKDDKLDASLSVFSLTPVQPFIGRARKLRDFWVGSVILSYLAFTGIRTVCKELGPDHIMYPSLHDQSLVEAWIGKEFHLERFLKGIPSAGQSGGKGDASIASFPNKFVFLCPTPRIEEIQKQIRDTIQKEWERTASLVLSFLEPKAKSAGQDIAALKRLFEHQIEDYWEFGYASARLAPLGDLDITKLVPKRLWEPESATQTAFATKHHLQAVAKLYGSTHTLVQSLLASAKLKPSRIRKAQAGEKCPLCGEHEVLHGFAQAGTTAANEYARATKQFWDAIRRLNPDEESTSEVGEHERLCAVCAIKRFLPRALRSRAAREGTGKDHLLAAVLDDSRFPSTTGMAAMSYLDRLCDAGILSHGDRDAFVQSLHQIELEDEDDEHSKRMRNLVTKGKSKNIHFTNVDHYYALLLMDGDKMGDLVNGSTVSATWGSVLHPTLRKRYGQAGFVPRKDALGVRLDEKRGVSPTVHAAVSDALNAFARFAVAPIVARYRGTLVYAGGDDVCAIFPLHTVLRAADEIRQAYRMGFVRYDQTGSKPLGTDAVSITPDARFGIHPGAAQGISISAGIVVAHHKTPLRETISQAHRVLDGVAKDKTGRNAVAIRLRKRSGGDRDFSCQWDDTNIFASSPETLFESFCSVLADAEEDMSTSLIYRLEDLRVALEPLMDSIDKPDTRDRIVRLFLYEVGHTMSGSGSKLPPAEHEERARQLAGICIRKDARGTWFFEPEAAVIARFLPQNPDMEGHQ